jgi:transcriptional regulator
MYKVPEYTNVTQNEAIAFIKENPFGIITNSSAEFPVATHFPFLVEEIDGKVLLSGHFMRKTDHQLSFEKNNKVLIIFYSQHAYVDANWYNNKGVGSTVDYKAVHAKGILTFDDDAAALKTFEKITNKYIDANSEAGYNQITDEYKHRMMKAVAAFTIELTHIEALFKLHQGKTIEEKQNIVNQLRQRQQNGDAYIANEIEKQFI